LDPGPFLTYKLGGGHYLLFFCAFFPSFIPLIASVVSIHFRANLDAQNAGNGISGLQISKIFCESMPPHMWLSAIAIPL
jgi:hypothetical protein